MLEKNTVDFEVWADALVEAAETFEQEAKADFVLAFMVKNDLPLTREVYLCGAFWEPNPYLDAEGEANLPTLFQREPVDGGVNEEEDV